LRSLYARFPGIDEVCDEHARAYDGYAAYLPAGSMLGELGIAASTVPSPVPYLHADSVKIARFAQQFASLRAARRVGIAWAGSPEHKRDRHRSCALAEFGALAGIDGVAFVSLQKGAALEQAASPPAGLDLLRIDDRLETLDDTAAAIAALDLVICVDTAVGHLAGAMGKPVWLLNGFGNYWLWGLRKATTPWYPSMRLFHQDRPGDWASIFRDVRAALEERD
jgi:hypothetical protein